MTKINKRRIVLLVITLYFFTEWAFLINSSRIIINSKNEEIKYRELISIKHDSFYIYMFDNNFCSFTEKMSLMDRKKIIQGILNCDLYGGVPLKESGGSLIELRDNYNNVNHGFNIMAFHENGAIYENAFNAINNEIDRNIKIKNWPGVAECLCAGIKFSKLYSEANCSIPRGRSHSILKLVVEHLETSAVSSNVDKNLIRDFYLKNKPKLYFEGISKIKLQHLVDAMYGSDGNFNIVLMNKYSDGMPPLPIAEIYAKNILIPFYRRIALSKHEVSSLIENLYKSMERLDLVKYREYRDSLMNDKHFYFLSHCDLDVTWTVQEFDREIIIKQEIQKTMEQLVGVGVTSVGVTTSQSGASTKCHRRCHNVGVTTSQSAPSTTCHTGLASNHEQKPAGFPPSPSASPSRPPQNP